ncbi:substrate-binding domain-containing protein [Microbaculum marinisediminis]|uniref:Substrate-binding domain-containing protein n=1 Tax=Microbaculum marinisediminis TaxID=2931392 RepID=A0AAW5R1E6_9HYPH|nr:substrate-binding domain-containing protein [Microbaculum sp. A6E488]MCT8973803.1 substrate-binding domain-containing protein [Microbaculum sp. A6E488]
MANGLRIFVPVAIQALMDRLRPRLEATAGQALTPLVDLNPVIPERIAAGEAFDIGLTNPPYVEALVAAGRVDGASHRPFGRVPLAIGRRAGTGESVPTGVAEIAALLSGADSIGYTGAGTSGRTYLNVMARLGLSETLAPRGRPMGAGEPVASVVVGDTELAVAPLTTILSSPGIGVAAIFPDALGAHIDMSVFLSPMPGAGAAAVLERLTGPELDAELAAAGVVRFAFD